MRVVDEVQPNSATGRRGGLKSRLPPGDGMGIGSTTRTLLSNRDGARRWWGFEQLGDGDFKNVFPGGTVQIGRGMGER